MQRKRKIEIAWSPNFAYAIGLITTDGNLSGDGRHLDFTSKDKSLVLQLKECLGLQNKIGRKARGGEKIKKYYRIQFGDKNFYEFLLNIGLMPAKSKKLKDLRIDEKYFADFLRGCIDGDGCIDAFKHPESKYPQIRIRIASASPPFLNWLHKTIKRKVAVLGGWLISVKRAWQLTFAKADSLELLRFIYYAQDIPFLERKERKARKFMRV